jgi:hypothetical protein
MVFWFFHSPTQILTAAYLFNFVISGKIILLIWLSETYTYYCKTHKVISNCDEYSLSIFIPYKFKTGRNRRQKIKKYQKYNTQIKLPSITKFDGHIACFPKCHWLFEKRLVQQWEGEIFLNVTPGDRDHNLFSELYGKHIQKYGIYMAKTI